MNSERKELKNYFYGPIWAKILGVFAFPIAIILLFIMQSGMLFFISFIGMEVASFIGMMSARMPNANTETLYDNYLKNDIEIFLKQGFEKLGVDVESTSLIEPIKTAGAYFDYMIPDYELRRKNIFRHIRQLILKVGADDEVRASLVQVTLYYFTEEQVLCYQVNYDICDGTFFGDETAEYFYRDIDCVRTGEVSRKVWYKKKEIEKRLEFFSVVVGSGSTTKAVSDLRVHILETQVKGMRNLIRSKKEELR